MNSTFWKPAVCLGGICVFGLSTIAAPLQRAHVPSDAAWLLHLDCDALRPTTIGQYVLAEAEKPEAKAKLAVFQSIFNFDLRTQLHGITLYGSSPAPEDGVLIIYADFDSARLTTMAQMAKDYSSSRHGQNVIHSWTDEEKKAKDGVKPKAYAAIDGNRVIFGQQEKSVVQALDVLATIKPNLGSSKAFPELGQPSNTHFVEAAVLKMKLPDSDPNAAILKMSQSIQLMLGESQKQFTGNITLIADNEEIAGHLLSITQGLIALTKLQTDKPESVKVANAITFKQDAGQVIGNLSLPASDVVEIMKADAARKAAVAAKAEKK